MDSIRIYGNGPLKGKIRIGGAKNAALPLMAACLLTSEKMTFTNVPDLADITSMNHLLEHLGVKTHHTLASDPSKEGGHLTLEARDNIQITAEYEIVRKMRASILVLGPLVARFKEAKVSLPGGCAIGVRPVDLHLKGLEKLGANIVLENGYIHAMAPQGLKGCEFTFPIVSVTGTENLLMAACLADGETRLVNAAREPEVTDLAHCLMKMGAKIEGIGTDTLIIQGVPSLKGCTHSILPDRIETGTYVMAAAITGGELELIGTDMSLLTAPIDVLIDAGVTFEQTANGFKVKRTGPLKSVDITTEPYPGFPTDLQAQFMALMTIAEGATSITETIWENRFMHVSELARMGANIHIHGSSAIVRQVDQLVGAPVMATDLRASVSLVLAALVAQGETIISRIYHLDRGYEHIEAKLNACGAKIERLKE
jgi:UDP-N-acetylglucosamine 1-carboxyvinyltransferase